MEITVLHNQSILDVAIQYTGDVSNMFVIAVANQISVSDFLISGSKIVIPENVQNNTGIRDYYKSKGIKPATGLTKEEIEDIPTLKGIGYMIINRTFKLD